MTAGVSSIMTALYWRASWRIETQSIDSRPARGDDTGESAGDITGTDSMVSDIVSSRETDHNAGFSRTWGKGGGGGETGGTFNGQVADRGGRYRVRGMEPLAVSAGLQCMVGSTAPGPPSCRLNVADYGVRRYEALGGTHPEDSTPADFPIRILGPGSRNLDGSGRITLATAAL